MIALALHAPFEEERGLLRWILPSSVAIHLLAFAWMPSAHRVPSPPLPPLVIDVAEPSPLAPPPPKAEEPAPAPPPSPVRTVAASVAPSRAFAPTTPPSPIASPAAEAPMDFTSTVFSNDGPGLAIGTPAPRSAPLPAAVSSAKASAPLASRVVPPASLARRPRAPGLDAELERQYPIEARRSGISGTAVLRVRVLPDGRVGEVQILSETWAGFGPACERTVRAARWEPPIDREGASVTTEITYTCRFEVRS